MITIGTTQLWVHDQDEALRFWTEQVGFEVRSDVTLEDWALRWLTVAAPGQDVELVLMAVPGPPVMDAGTAADVRALTAKGFAGTLFLVTDDCRKAYEDLRARGVEFTQEPTEQPYGVDCAFRDPSGNSVRLGEINGRS